MKYYKTIITYDAMGNPLSYRDGMKMTWQNGRKLTSLKTNDNSITYKYDSNGLRTQKDDKNCTTCYYYDSKNNLIGIHYKLAPVLYFYYDSNGNVTSFSFNNTMYYYVKNLQGDVVKIIDKSGKEVVTYTYDAWGKILKQTDSTIYNLANLNPFKYRSYVYDNESGLYYLQSRYYDPVTGRFLNADDTTYLSYTSNVINSNLYAYCRNNPISYVDKTGNLFIANTYFHFIVAVGAYAAYKEFQMTIEMYLLSFFNDEYEKEYNFSYNTSYINKIKNTNAYKKLITDSYKIIRRLIENVIHEQRHIYQLYTSDGYPMDFSEDTLDSQYALGKVAAHVFLIRTGTFHSIVGTSTFWNIRIVFRDKYDFSIFDYKKNGIIKTFINNNFGYNLQDTEEIKGFITPYIWYLAINIPYIYLCTHDKNVY